MSDGLALRGIELVDVSLTRFYIAGMDSTRRAALQAGALVALADAFALRRAWGSLGERVAIALAVGAIVVGAALALLPWLALLDDRGTGRRRARPSGRSIGAALVAGSASACRWR